MFYKIIVVGTWSEQRLSLSGIIIIIVLINIVGMLLTLVSEILTIYQEWIS